MRSLQYLARRRGAPVRRPSAAAASHAGGRGTISVADPLAPTRAEASGPLHGRRRKAAAAHAPTGSRRNGRPASAAALHAAPAGAAAAIPGSPALPGAVSSGIPRQHHTPPSYASSEASSDHRRAGLRAEAAGADCRPAFLRPPDTCVRPLASGVRRERQAAAAPFAALIVFLLLGLTALTLAGGGCAPRPAWRPSAAPTSRAALFIRPRRR